MSAQPTLDRPSSGPWRLLAWGGAALLFLLPVVAQRFTREMAWSGGDFVLFAGMLVAACVAFEIALRAAGGNAYRWAAAIALATGFAIVWINLAVGVIGGEANPANLLFAGVLAIGLGGAAVTRLRAAGMARVLTAMALAQGAIGVYALVQGSVGALLFCLACAGAWFTSARLFRKAAGNA